MDFDKVKTVVMCIIGSVFEWYDFTLFGILAPVLSKVFFPSQHKVTALLLTFALFATSFLMRPLGSIVFGHVGDRYGRKHAVLVSIGLMTIATVGIGLLPTSQQSSYTIVAMLLMLKLLQGFAVSGEYAGVLTFIAETVPARRYYFFQSFMSFGTTCGVLLGTFVGSLALSYPSANAWRLPFIASAVLGLIGFYLRSTAVETTTFQRLVKNNLRIQLPLLRVIQQHKKMIALLVLAIAADTTGFYFIVVYYPSFLVQMGLPETHYLHATTIGLLLMLLVTPVVGYVTDRLHLFPMLVIGLLSFMIVPPLVMAMVTHDHSNAFIGQLLLFIPLMIVDPIVVAGIPRWFPANIRYTSVAIAVSLSVTLFGGTTPLLSTYLLHQTQSFYAPALYLMSIAFVSLCAVVVMHVRRLQHNQITGQININQC